MECGNGYGKDKSFGYRRLRIGRGAAWVVPLVMISIVLVGVVGTQAQLSGSSRLDLIATPIPCTLVDEIKLDTPCERTLLMFDIESIIKLNLTVGGMVFSESLAISIAGLEHLVLSLNTKLGDVTLKPEVWFAVPFESVTDVNNMPNMVVIPPGHMLFVKKRFTLEMDIGRLKLKNLAMFEDVNFPSPGAGFGPLFYGPQSQSFAFGDIITISGQTASGISFSSRTGICAQLGGNSVKKYAASGRVDPDCVADGFKLSFETISVGGIEVGGMQLGEAITFRPENTPPILATTSVAFIIFGTAAVSTSFTTLPLELRFGGISVGIFADPLTLNLNFSSEGKFSWTGSANFRTAFIVGAVTTVLSAITTSQSGTGLTGLSMGLSISTGTFSANHSVAFTRQEAGLKFASLSIRFSLNVSPAVFSIQPTFGQGGLARLAIQASVVF